MITQPPQPRLVTYQELKAKLEPLCNGWPWALDAIRDLWLKGAPVPTGPHTPETRILLPGQFAAWWREVQARQGLATPAAAIFPTITPRRQAGARSKLT